MQHRGLKSSAQKFLEDQLCGFMTGCCPGEDNPLRRQVLDFQQKTREATGPSLINCESFDAEESTLPLPTKTKFFGFIYFMVYTNFGGVYFLLSWEGDSDSHRVVALVEVPPHICLWDLRPDEASFLLDNRQPDTPPGARALDTKIVRYRGTALLREDSPTVFAQNIGRRKKLLLADSFVDPANDNCRIAIQKYWSQNVKREKVFIRRLDARLKPVLVKEFNLREYCSFLHFANGYFLGIFGSAIFGQRAGSISIDLYSPDFEYAGRVLSLPWDEASEFVRQCLHPYCEGAPRQTPKVLLSGGRRWGSWDAESGDCRFIHKFYLCRWTRVPNPSTTQTRSAEFVTDEEIFEVEVSFRG